MPTISLVFTCCGHGENTCWPWMRPADIVQDDLKLLKRVVETAKKYFKNPERFEKARREVLGEDDEQ